MAIIPTLSCHPFLLSAFLCFIFARVSILSAIHFVGFSMIGVGGSDCGCPGTANDKSTTLSSMELDTLRVEVVEGAAEEGPGVGSGADPVVVPWVLVALGVRTVGVELLTSDARATTFSRISTPAASKTSTIGA